MTQSSWWRSGVIYQIYPRSFQDASGHGIGTINGITSRLDYLQKLQITAIWISPFFESPMHDFGYDVSNHRAVDPMFGTDDDFATLISEAHARDIRIIIDLVLSHSSIQHPWFLESRQSRDNPKADYYVWADPSSDGTPPNNWLSIFGGAAWTWEPQREQYYLHNFLATQPDLNFHHPAVRREALSIAEYWLDRGVDGFRLDTVNFYFHDRMLRDNPPSELTRTTVVPIGNPYGRQDHVYDKNRPEVLEFLEELGALLARYPDRMALGEVGAEADKSADLIRRYVQPDKIQLCYSFDLLSDVFNADHFRDFMTVDADIWRCLAFSNHDVTRTATRLQQVGSSDYEIAALSMALLLSLKGTPCIYQGEELGLQEAEIPFEKLVDPYGKKFYPEYKGRDGCRTPMPWTSSRRNCGFTDDTTTPWLPIPDMHRERAVDAQISSSQSMLTITRELLHMRQNHAALHQDGLKMLPGTETRLEFIRGTEACKIYCAFNLSSETATYRLDRNTFHIDKILHCAKNFEYSGDTLRLPPWGWVFSKEG